jgi:HEPN domain-containing protein
MEDITKKWLNRARYDLETADAMFKTGRYLYVAFMCQQALEKVLKAIIIEKGGEALRTHNLIRLAELCGINSLMKDDDKNFLADLTPFVIESRYGDYKKRLSEIINKRTAAKYLKKTKEIFQCLKKKLK